MSKDEVIDALTKLPSAAPSRCSDDDGTVQLADAMPQLATAAAGDDEISASGAILNPDVNSADYLPVPSSCTDRLLEKEKAESARQQLSGSGSGKAWAKYVECIKGRAMQPSDEPWRAQQAHQAQLMKSFSELERTGDEIVRISMAEQQAEETQDAPSPARVAAGSSFVNGTYPSSEPQKLGSKQSSKKGLSLRRMLDVLSPRGNK